MNFSYNPIENGKVFRLKKSKKNGQFVAYTDISVYTYLRCDSCF